MCGKASSLVFAVLVCVCAAGATETPASSYINRLFSDDGSVGRTWGHHVLKRLAFIFLPVMFTLGVISTLLLGLTVLSIKNLAIGVILLIVGISQALSRLFYTAAAPPAPPLLHYAHLHSRSEPSFAAPWPAPGAPAFSPWARSDQAGADVNH